MVTEILTDVLVVTATVFVAPSGEAAVPVNEIPYASMNVPTLTVITMLLAPVAGAER